MLRVLAQYHASAVDAVPEQDVIDFLDSSLAAFQAREGRDPQWTADRLAEGFGQLVHASFVESVDGGYRLTNLGRFAGTSGVHVDSIIKLSLALQGIDGTTIKSTGLVAAAQITNELDDVYIGASLRKNSPEFSRWSSLLQQQDVPYPLLTKMQIGADNAKYVRRNKRAIAVIMWINGMQMAAIETALNQHMWGRPGIAGAVRQTLDRTRDLLPAVGAVMAELHPHAGTHVAALLERTLIRLEFGIPPDLIELATAADMLTRSQLLSLKSAGIATPALVLDAHDEALEAALGSGVVVGDLKTACRDALERDAPARVDLPKPSE